MAKEKTISVHRSNLTENYTKIANHIFDNEGATGDEFGLLFYMMHMPPEWEFSITGLAKGMRLGVCTVSKRLNKLKELGYVEIHSVRDKGRICGVHYDVYDVPPSHDETEQTEEVADMGFGTDMSRPIQVTSAPEKPYVEKPYVEKPYVEKPYVEKPYVEKPYVEKPYAEKPYAEKPYVEKPYAENLPQESIDNINNNNINNNNINNNNINNNTHKECAGAHVCVDKNNMDNPKKVGGTVGRYFPDNPKLDEVFTDWVRKQGMNNNRLTRKQIERNKEKLLKIAIGEDGVIDEELAVETVIHVTDRGWKNIWPMGKDDQTVFRQKRPPGSGGGHGLMLCRYSGEDMDELEKSILAN